MSSSNIWKKIGIGAAVAGGVIAGVALIPITLGFGGAGIVAGSVAAGIQAAIGNVAAGSVFAICTSLGMTGVFASSAAVGAILGTGGLAAYIKGRFDAKKDAELIRATIVNRDNPDIIMRLLESRFPKQREQIREKYEELNPGNNFDNDILNFIPINSRIHVDNMLKRTSDINADSPNVKLLFDNKTFKDYCDLEFKDFRDALLIDTIISSRDNPLMIIRLLNYRTENERKKIDKKFRERKGDMRRKMILYILDYMTDNPEIFYFHTLLDVIK
jgi:hypothetical protein